MHSLSYNMTDALKSKHPNMCNSKKKKENQTKSIRKKKSNYSHTFENKSSAPNPPAGLGLVVLVVATGAALSQVPKSSSAATVGAGLAAEPHPEPTSLAVSFSGTFIMDAVEGCAAGTGSGSGALHALPPPPPQGSMLEESMLALTAGVETVAVSGCGLGAGGGEGLRLKADFISSCGERTGGGAVAVLVGGGGDARPKRSSEADGPEDKGLLGCGAAGAGAGEAKSVKPRSCPKENESLRDWGLGDAVPVGEVRLSNKLELPAAEAVGEETFGAAGGDLILAKLARLANGEAFSAGFDGGGEAVDGMVNPLNASVRPPMFDEPPAGGAGADAISPKEGAR